MTSVRSLAAGVAALGFASTFTVSLPAQAAPLPALPAHSSASIPLRGAPAPCERAERYAAQAKAEFLRVERLDLRGAVTREHGAGMVQRDSGVRPSVSGT